MIILVNKMSLTHKTTLLNESDVAAVESYISTMMNSHRSASSKREVLAYLKRILENDKAQLNGYSTKFRKAAELIRDHSIRSEITGQTEIPHLLTADARTIDQLIALLQADNGVLFGVDYTFDNTVFAPLMSNESRFVIQGDNARFFGEANNASAKTQELQCSCIVKAPLHLKPVSGATEIQSVVIDGVKFMPNSAEHTVTFETKVQNLTFTNCIFDGTNHNDSKCIWGTTETFEGTLTLKNCIIQNYTSWGYMDPTTSSSATPSKQLALVDIQDCLFLNNKGSMAFRTVDDPTSAGFPATTETFQFINNVINVSGLSDLHNLNWSAVECNNFQNIVVKDNVAQGIRASSTGIRGFLQIWSKGPDMVFDIQNNKLTDFNIAYQLAFGNESNTAVFKGCTSTASHVTIAQNDLTRVDHTHKLVYPWLSTTATVNISGSGVLPTITVPNVTSNFSVNDYPLIEAYTWTTEAAFEAYVFQLGNNATGYIQINNTTLLDESVIKHFTMNLNSSLITANPTKLWLDMVTTPDGSSWKVHEQERSFSSGTLNKILRFNPLNDPNGDTPANAAYVFRLYFKIE